MAQIPLPTNTALHGYRIERVLGSGGFGITYLARDLLEQPFAIKEYFPAEFATRNGLIVRAASEQALPMFEDCRERFLREARALVRLIGKSDGIVPVRTYFEANGTCYLVMDYVEGVSLATLLHANPSEFSASRVNSLLTQLLSIIRVVHQAGLMHRDIKPMNIILSGNDRVRLIDFGSSRDTSHAQTNLYTQIFSPNFAPLEQMLGLPQGPYSDIFAIGAVGYRAIGGVLVNSLSRHHALLANRSDPQMPAMQVGSGRYPRSLLKAIDAALAIDPELRPQSADAMLAALHPDESIGEAATTKCHSTSVYSRRPYVAIGAALTLGVLALIGFAYLAPRVMLVRSPIEPEAHREATPAGARQEAAQQEAQRDAAQREAAQREAAQREAQREAAQREAAQREEAQREAAQREAAQREAQREAAQREAAQREEAQREAAQREAAQREAAQREAQREAAQQEEAQREAAQRGAAQREAAQRKLQGALTVLGYYRPASGSQVSGMNAAIALWQQCRGVDGTDAISAEQRDNILRDAERMVALLKVPVQSPRGLAARGLKGPEDRFKRGFAFDRGDTQAQDAVEAIYWYSLSAGGGWAPAFTNLGRLFASGRGVPERDFDTARLLWETAAALGDSTAMFNLGMLEEKGLGRPSNPAMARRWYSRGAAHNHSDSAAALQRLGD